MIDVQGIPTHNPLHEYVQEQLEELLPRVRTGKVPIKTTFEDQNGPKGGADTLCTITVRIPRQAEVVVSHQAKTPRLAFDGAFDSVRRQIERSKDRRRERARRPKKYYAAKRLLEGGPPEPPDGAEESGETTGDRTP